MRDRERKGGRKREATGLPGILPSAELVLHLQPSWCFSITPLFPHTWSIRPHMLGVRRSPWYANSISPRNVSLWGVEEWRRKTSARDPNKGFPRCRRCLEEPTLFLSTPNRVLSYQVVHHTVRSCHQDTHSRRRRQTFLHWQGRAVVVNLNPLHIVRCQDAIHNTSDVTCHGQGGRVWTSPLDPLLPASFTPPSTGSSSHLSTPHTTHPKNVPPLPIPKESFY
jgi:hypothetical protein